MSAPPLPEAFGNYALGDFAEVVSPAAVSWLPQTVAWRWLAAALAVYLLYRGWRWLRHWHRNRYRRSIFSTSETIAFTSVTLASITCCRLNANNCFVNPAALSPASWMFLIDCCNAPSSLY